MDYKLRNGNVIVHDIILEYEKLGYSDAVIAEMYGLSRMGFSKVRKKMGWVRKFPGIRSDKGKRRK